ncbi:MAG: DUF748 domain-containing protein [Geobacteraceae bacterium]|nr:DUF748 domain-containing protein [Geobacteraceae bacterium]
MTRRRKIAMISVVVFVLLLLFAAFILPFIVRNQLETRISKAVDRKCTVEKVYINPLNWSAEVVGVKLSEKSAGATFVSFSSLKVQVSPSSLWRFAPVVSELKLTSPNVHIQRNGPNNFNFTDIIEKSPKKKGGDPARFSLNNIVIENGRVIFDDNGLPIPIKHTVDKITVHIPFISNISYFADKYVDPKLYAVVNGAPLDFAGKLKPFEKGLKATMEINLKELDLPFYVEYYPGKLPVKIVKGGLDASLKISHHLVKEGKSDIHLSGVLSLDDLVVAEVSGASLFSFKKLTTEIGSIALLDQSYAIEKISLESPNLAVSRDKSGAWNFARLKGDAPKKEEPNDAPKKSGTMPNLTVKSMQVSGGTVSFRDDQAGGGFSTDLKEFTFEVDGFGTRSEIPATYQISTVSGRKEKISAKGNFALEPLALTSRVSLSDLVLESYYPYLAASLNDPLVGKVDFGGDLAFTPDSGLKGDHLMLRLKGAKVPFGKSDGVLLPLVVADGGVLKLKEKELSLERLTVSGGRVDISRDSSGNISTSLLAKKSGEPPAAAPATASSDDKKFSVKVGKVAVNGFKASFKDGMKEDAKFESEKINAELSSVSWPKFTSMPMKLSVEYGKGEIAAEGRLLPAPLAYSGSLKLSRVPFTDFEPYLPAGVNVSFLDGRIDTRLAIDLTMKDGKAFGSFSGEAGIRDLYTVDAVDENDLLKWESLSLEKLSGNFEPFSLAVSGVSLNNYYARVIVNKNGKMNLQELYKQQAKAAAPAPEVAQKPAPARDIRIDTITLSGGTLDFSDYHLNRQFSTNMLNMGGRVSGLSSDSRSAADIDLRGNLENHSPLKISGKINPLASALFLDMQINFSDIELSPLTPYSGTYLGYVIDKGKLSLALNYKVENSTLTAENRVFIDQFTFGDKVESEKATSLPVRLAVALLKDKNGEIHLDLPLSGKTDSPKFSIWGLLGQVLQNLLVKAATSPMALLQSAFGGGGDFSSIGFHSGSSRLEHAEAEKLRSLAKALHDRPGIHLEVQGFADMERDPEGYKSELLLKKMKSEKILTMSKEKRESGLVKPELVEIPESEYSRWLKAVYEKEKFPKPRTVVGTLQSMPDTEMKKLILANTAVSEQQLRTLARERTLSVIDFLLKEEKVPQERIFEKSSDPFAKSEKTAGGRVEFGVLVK